MTEYRLYTILDLESHTGVPPRRIRSWIERGVVPPAYRGAPHYGTEHLRAIREVRDFQDGQMTLAELAERKAYKLQTHTWDDEGPSPDEDPADDIDISRIISDLNDPYEGY